MARVAHLILPMAALAAAEASAQAILPPTRYELDFDVDHDEELLHTTAANTLETSSSQPVQEASLPLYRLQKATSVRSTSRNGGSTNDLVQLVTKRGGSAVAGLVDDWISKTGWVGRIERGDSIATIAQSHRSGR